MQKWLLRCNLKTGLKFVRRRKEGVAGRKKPQWEGRARVKVDGPIPARHRDRAPEGRALGSPCNPRGFLIRWIGCDVCSVQLH